MTDLGAAPSLDSGRDLSAKAGTGHQVAAVVVCYNQAAFVRQCLDSVLIQTVSTQLVIVDDASTDESQRIINEWVAERSVDARLILHETNQGVCRSFNDGARAVRSPYTAFMAADDFWLPGKLARQLAMLENLPASYGMVYSDALLCDETGAWLPGSCIDYLSRRLPWDRPTGWIFSELMRNNFIPAPGVMMRTTSLVELGGFDESLRVEDLDFWLRMSRRYQVWYDNVPLGVYRLSPSSMVRTYEIPIMVETMKVYLRYLDQGGRDRRLAMEALSRGFYRLYAAGAPVGPRFLWLSLRLSFNWQPAALLPFAVLGLNAQRYKRLRAWMKPRLPILRRLEL